MTSLRFFGVVLIIAVLSGCAVDEVLRIRSLSTQSNPFVASEVGGAFDGLKPLTEHAGNTNIVFVHGIGWTQERGSTQFGDELTQAVLRGYPGAIIRANKYTCGTSSLDGRREDNKDKRGLLLHASATSSLQSDDPNFSVSVSELGCLDRTIIDLPTGKTITIYRLLWDDAMWNGAEWFHMGFDDPIPTVDGKKLGHEGYDDPDKLRAKLNSQLKNSIVTYGLTDAALYMSPVGKLMRDGVQATICIALSDSFEAALATGPTAKSTDLCEQSPKARAPLILMSHSLGSRVVFDTLISDLSPTLSARIAEGTSNNNIELHMFANQIPLIGVGRLGEKRTSRSISGKFIKVVAYSEINDLLTYELVPYFEQMYYVRCYGAKAADPNCKAAPDAEWTKRSKSFFRDFEARRQLVSDLGFDVIDVRLQFAPNEIAIYSGLKSPAIAHSGHMKSDSVVSLFLCGVESGKPRIPMSTCLSK